MTITSYDFVVIMRIPPISPFLKFNDLQAESRESIESAALAPWPGAPAASILLLMPCVAKETFASLRERPLQEGSRHFDFWDDDSHFLDDDFWMTILWMMIFG